VRSLISVRIGFPHSHHRASARRTALGTTGSIVPVDRIAIPISIDLVHQMQKLSSN
jgi:hypothetical protein